MIPDGWKPSTIGSQIKFSGGSQPPREVFSSYPQDGYIRLIQIRDYKTDKFTTYIPKSLAKKLCAADDIMIGRYGPPIFQILRGLEGAYNVALIKAIPSKYIDKEFMYYFLSKASLLKYIESFSQRTSGQTGIEMDLLKDYPMPVPPLLEQKKIAQILSTWDKAIAVTEQLINNCTKQSKALLQQIFSRKIRFIDENHQSFSYWRISKLSEFLIPKLRQVEKPKESFLSIGIRSHFKGTFHKLEQNPNTIVMDKLYVVKQDDFIVNITFAWEGALAIVKECDDGGFVSHRFPTYIFDTTKTFPNFFKYIYLQPKFIFDLQRCSPGGAGRNRVLNKKDFLNIEVNLPPLPEQQKIAEVLTTADKEIELLKQKLACLKQEKQALMQQLLTGKKRVKVEN